MTEQELRTLVRDTIARQPGLSAAPAASAPQPTTFHRHASHGLFVLPAGADTDGPCIIEPAVRCHHCGYCQSYGH